MHAVTQNARRVTLACWPPRYAERLTGQRQEKMNHGGYAVVTSYERQSPDYFAAVAPYCVPGAVWAGI